MPKSNRKTELAEVRLIRLATEAYEMAYAPYSDFRVGAAVLTADGRTFSGCNVENSTYSLTICAERVAIFKAVSDGARELAKVVVVTDHPKLTPPCGCCRQMIWEFSSGDTEVILANLQGETERHGIRELLPQAFDSSWLERRKRRPRT